MKLDRKYLKVFVTIDLIIIAVVVWFFFIRKAPTNTKTEPGNGQSQAVNSFETCAAAGNPVQESYPETCVSKDGKHFTNPDQKAPTTPEAPANKDDEAILNVLVADCVKKGADESDAKTMISISMQDKSLYVRDGNYVRISTSCGEEGGGFRSFLHYFPSLGWHILGSGQMNTIGCKDLDGTGVPKTIAATCFDANGEERPVK